MRLLLIILAICAFSTAIAYSPRPGDLLFQDIQCQGICKAITAVTHNKHAMPINHVAMLISRDTVIEAEGNNVQRTKLRKFLQRSRDKAGRPLVIVGRLKPQYRKLISRAVHIALSWQGRPYNYAFAYHNNFKSFYCSQLIYDAFMLAAKKPFFQLTKMTFKRDGQTLAAWQRYFKHLQKPIPEGQPGSNPALLARSNKIKIIYSYAKTM